MILFGGEFDGRSRTLRFIVNLSNEIRRLRRFKLLLSKFEVFLGNSLHQRLVILSSRIRINNSEHPVHDVDGYRSDLITAFSDEALERFLDFPRWPHLQKRMTKVSGLQSFLLHHHSRDGVAAN